MLCLVCLKSNGQRPALEVVRALSCTLDVLGAINTGSAMVVDEYTVCIDCDDVKCKGQDCTAWEWQEDTEGERRVHLIVPIGAGK